MLMNSIKDLFPEATSARLLKRGDIRIKFDNIIDKEKNLNISASSKFKKTFGNNSSITRWSNPFTTAVIYKVPTDTNIDDLKNHLSSNLNCKVDNLKFFTPDKPLSSLRVEFDNVNIFNSTLNKQFVNIGWKKHRIKKFINRNPIRCFNCQKFGHYSKLCQHKKTCTICGVSHGEGECSEKIKCANCGEEHKANDKTCKAFLEEKNRLKRKQIKTKSKFANNSFFGLNMYHDELPKNNEEDNQNIIGLTNKPKKQKRKRRRKKKPIGDNDKIDIDVEAVTAKGSEPTRSRATTSNSAPQKAPDKASINNDNNIDLKTLLDLILNMTNSINSILKQLNVSNIQTIPKEPSSSGLSNNNNMTGSF